MALEYWQFKSTTIRNMSTGVEVARTAAPPPPAVPPMKIGAWNAPSGLTNWNNLQAQVGNMNLLRSYSSALPNSWSGAGCSWHPAGSTTWHSVRSNWNEMTSGSLDATVIAFLNSVPANKNLWLTFSHEPENDGGIASEFRAASRHFYTLVKAYRPETKVGPIFMDWTWNTKSGRNPEDWHPGPGFMDFMGIDTYNTYYWPMVGSPTKWDEPVSPALLRFYQRCVDFGVPPAIGEVASREHFTEPLWKKQWMQTLVADAATRGCLGVAWFNSFKPGDTTEDMLLGSSANSIAAWQGITATYVGA